MVHNHLGGTRFKALSNQFLAVLSRPTDLGYTRVLTGSSESGGGLSDPQLPGFQSLEAPCRSVFNPPGAVGAILSGLLCVSVGSPSSQIFQLETGSTGGGHR